jgi:hypothetical protein
MVHTVSHPRLVARRQIGVAVLVLAASALLPSLARAQDSIRVVPLARDGVVLVSFDLADGFTEDVRAAISSGLRTTITYTVELRLEVPFWIDRTIASTVVSNTVQYDNLTRRHNVSRAIDGRVDESKVTEDQAVVRTWLTALQRLPLFETSKLEPNREYYIRVSARTQPGNGALPWTAGVASGLAKFTFIP